jgi:tetratricopeptide (TPR) repeat protein
MLDCRYRGLFSVVAGGLLLAGCATSPPAHPASSTPVSDDSPAAAVTNSDVNETLVRAHAHYAQGLIYELEDQPEKADAELLQSAKDDPANTDLVLELTGNYLQQKQPEKALDLLVRATSIPGASGAMFARLGMVYSQLNKEDQAIAACQTAIKRAPAALDGYRNLFFIYVQKGDNKGALEIIRSASKAPSTNAEFNIELADLCVILQRQDPPEKKAIAANALALLKRADSQNPSNEHLRTRLAEDYDQVGDSADAVKIYRQLLDTFNDSPELRISFRDKLARIYLRQNDYPDAAEQLQGIVHDDPANAQAYYLLGTLADEAGKLPEAEDDFKKVVVLSENFEPAYYDLARVQIDLNQPGDAMTNLDVARHKFPVGFQEEVLTALAFEQQKKYTNALDHYTAAEVIAKATDAKRLNSGFYFNEGAAYERASNYDQAEQCFEKSLAQTPDFPEALNYLGYMWADRGVKLDKALDLIEKAVKLEPKSSAYLDSLGWVLYKLNRPAEALPNLQKAIQLSPEPDPTLYEHLGDIYAALKETDKARDAWTKSLSVEPNDDVRKKLDDASGKPSH